MARIKLHNPELATNSKFANLVIESLPTDPTLVGTTAVGRLWFNNTEKTFKGGFLDEAGTATEIKPLGIDNSAEVITNTLTIATEITNRTTADTTLQTNIDAVETSVATDYLSKTSTTAQVVTAETTFSNDLIVAGNLTISGTTTTINTETLLITDNIITLNNGTTGIPTENAGIEVNRGVVGVNIILNWNETLDQVEVFEDNELRKVATTNYVDGEITTLGVIVSTNETARANTDINLQTELDATQAGAGLGVDGTYTADVLTNYVTTATDLANADKLLDSQIKSNADATTTLDTRVATIETATGGKIGDLTILTTFSKDTLVGAINEVGATINTELTNRTTADTTLQINIDTESTDRTTADTNLDTRIDNINTATGITADVYTADVNTNYLATATDLMNADKVLDTTIKANSNDLAATTTTNGTNLIGYEGYTETNHAIVNPTIETVAGTLKETIDSISSLINTKIHDIENRYVKGEVADADKSDTYIISHNLDTEFVDVSVQVYDTLELVWRFDLVVIEVIDTNVVEISLASGSAEQIRYVIQGY